MSASNYDEYRKKIEDLFQSELDKSPNIEIKRILLVLTNPVDHQKIAHVVSELIQYDRAQLKILNALHFYKSKVEEQHLKVKTLDEIAKTIQNENLTTADICLVEEGDPFQGIFELIQTSRVDLIIIQYPFPEFLEEENSNKNTLGTTIENLVSFVLNQSPIPLLIVKNPDQLSQNKYNDVLMVMSDWINTRMFKTLLWVNRNLKPDIKIMPFYKKHVIISEIPPDDELKKIHESLISIYYDIQYYIKKYALGLQIRTLELTYDHHEIINYSSLENPDLVVLYVPRRPEKIPLFQEISRKVVTNILIVPEFKKSQSV